MSKKLVGDSAISRIAVIVRLMTGLRTDLEIVP